MLIPVADARVDKDAVVVSFGNATLADAAVLGSGGLEDATRPTFLSGTEESVVVRVE
jgi:hypothetical protein